MVAVGEDVECSAAAGHDELEGRLATAYSEQDEAYRDWVRKGKPILGQVKQGFF